MEPKIGIAHPEYGMGAAPPPTNVRALAHLNEFYGLMKMRVSKKTSKPMSSFTKVIPYYKQIQHKILQFSDLYDEADVRGILPTICAIGIKPTQHHDADEGNIMGLERSHKIDMSVVQAVIDDWKMTPIPHRNTLDLKLPKTTNLGYPFFFSNVKEARPLTLAALALALDVDKARNLSLADVFSRFRNDFGPPVLMFGTRTQFTSKVMPLLADGQHFWTSNFEGRSRLIAQASKVGVIWNRVPTKQLLKMAQSRPQHKQDRVFIQKKIDAMKADPSRDTLALDVGKFDKAHGGRFFEPAFRAFAKILNDESLVADFMAEVEMPIVFPYQKSLYATNHRFSPQIPSGVSSTTVLGLFWGDYIVKFIAKSLGLSLSAQALGTQWDYLNWGDDMVISVPKAVNIRENLSDIIEDLGIVLEEEPTLKYLGFNYGSGEYQTSGGYSQARLVSKIFLPERQKVGPTALIGYAARLEFIGGDPEEFHNRLLKLGWHEPLGAPFKYSELKGKAEEAIRKVNEQPELYDHDSLNHLVHGQLPSDEAEVLEILGYDYDFTDFLGGSMLDPDDADQYLADHGQDLPNVREHIRRISKGGSVSIRDFVYTMADHYGFRKSGFIF
jgi:hypothetical protein